MPKKLHLTVTFHGPEKAQHYQNRKKSQLPTKFQNDFKILHRNFLLEAFEITVRTVAG